MFKAVFTVLSSPETLPATETVQFAGPVHPRLRVALPVHATVERTGGQVRASAANLGISACGRSSGEALDALGRALALRYLEQTDPVLRVHIRDYGTEAEAGKSAALSS